MLLLTNMRYKTFEDLAVNKLTLYKKYFKWTGRQKAGEYTNHGAIASFQCKFI